jgi:hypothetical protein
MKTKKMITYILATLLGGCVPVLSLHPLYTEKDVVFENGLLGIWMGDPNNPETTWKFTRVDESKKEYNLIFTDDKGKKGSFTANLVKLQDELFLDVFPSELPWEPKDPNKVEWLYNSFFLIPAHTFLKVESTEPQLMLRLTDESKMKELLKQYPSAINHTTIEDRPILTASTKELQEFVIEYADDERLFTDTVILHRQVALEPNSPAPAKPATSDTKQ